MIKIKRPKVPDIDIYVKKNQKLTKTFRKSVLKLIDKNSVPFKHLIPRLKDENEKFTKAEKETLQAINYYGVQDRTNRKAPTFSVYKDKELKKELKRLFNKKCAYCDSSFLANSNADIEHFRPKKAFNPFKDNVDERLIEPGYYWLGADWNNLLWSCTFCNRKNNLDQPNIVGLRPLGKKNRFPISREARRIRSHNEDVKKEKRLLRIIDPCADDPRKHFVFPVNIDDELGIVKSKLSRRGKPSAKAVASIPLYGLNRVELVIARKEAALDLRAIFIGLLQSIQEFSEKKAAGEDFTEAAENFKFLKIRFQGKFADDSAFLNLKQSLLKDFENFPMLQRMGLKAEKLLE